MKRIILTILLSLTAATYASAQHARSVSMRLGEQKTLTGRVTVRFLEVVEDSRCPQGVACIWAGNAKVKLAVSRGRMKAEEIELNSGMEPHAAEAAGYRFEFVSLTPKRGEPGKLTSVRPKLVLKITRLKR